MVELVVVVVVAVVDTLVVVGAVVVRVVIAVDVIVAVVGLIRMVVVLVVKAFVVVIAVVASTHTSPWNEYPWEQAAHAFERCLGQRVPLAGMPAVRCKRWVGSVAMETGLRAARFADAGFCDATNGILVDGWESVNGIIGRLR